MDKFLQIIGCDDRDSSTSLVGTIPFGDQPDEFVVKYESIFNIRKTVNVTVTYNLSFADMDTIYEGPKAVESILLGSNKFHSKDYIGVKDYYFVNEKHANDKRWHMHGQVILYYSQRTCGIKQLQNLYKKLNSIGRTSVKWNNPDYEVKSDQHKTYTQYCFKESKIPVIQSVQDRII